MAISIYTFYCDLTKVNSGTVAFITALFIKLRELQVAGYYNSEQTLGITSYSMLK